MSAPDHAAASPSVGGGSVRRRFFGHRFVRRRFVGHRFVGHRFVGHRSAIGVRVAAILLGAACVAWSATPSRHTGLADLALFLAIGCAAAGTLRIALGWLPRPEVGYLVSTPMRTWIRVQDLLRTLPWEEGATVAVIWLEVQHPARPWHTAALGAALTAYLLTVHLAESSASPHVLRPQARALTIGACLLALAAGAATISAAPAGGGSALLRALAAIAVVAAAALILPAV